MASEISQEAQEIIGHIHEAAFGFDPSAAKRMVMRMVQEGELELAIFCIGAVGQIRENVTVHRGLMKKMIEEFPELEINRSSGKSSKAGSAPSDRINLTGVRYAGYWLCHASQSRVARALLAKGGSPLTGVPAEKSGEVARINRELHAENGAMTITLEPALVTFAEKTFAIIEEMKGNTMSAAAR